MKLTGWDYNINERYQLYDNVSIPESFLIIQETLTGSIQELILNILQHKAIVVSDGSFFKESKTGAAAWYIESETKDGQI